MDRQIGIAMKEPGKTPLKIKDEFTFNSGNQSDAWVHIRTLGTPYNLSLQKLKAVIDWKD
jgi:hypothetical protein